MNKKTCNWIPALALLVALPHKKTWQFEKNQSTTVKQKHSLKLLLRWWWINPQEKLVTQSAADKRMEMWSKAICVSLCVSVSLCLSASCNGPLAQRYAISYRTIFMPTNSPMVSSLLIIIGPLDFTSISRCKISPIEPGQGWTGWSFRWPQERTGGNRRTVGFVLHITVEDTLQMNWVGVGPGAVSGDPKRGRAGTKRSGVRTQIRPRPRWAHLWVGLLTRGSFLECCCSLFLYFL